jgi:hypothetical protein
MRVADNDGHLWPVTGRRCRVCQMPTSDEDIHPTCIPPRQSAGAPPATDVAGAELLGHFDTRWQISGAPLPSTSDGQ